MDTGLLQCLVTCLPNCVVSYDHLLQPFYMCVANKQNPDYANGIRLVYLNPEKLKLLTYFQVMSLGSSQHLPPPVLVIPSPSDVLLLGT